MKNIPFAGLCACLVAVVFLASIAFAKSPAGDGAYAGQDASILLKQIKLHPQTACVREMVAYYIDFPLFYVGHEEVYNVEIDGLEEALRFCSWKFNENLCIAEDFSVADCSFWNK